MSRGETRYCPVVVGRLRGEVHVRSIVDLSVMEVLVVFGRGDGCGEMDGIGLFVLAGKI
jgi:hypothetical protein